MVDAISNNFLFIIRALVLIATAEMIISALWWRFYFIFGLPLFRSSIKITSEKVPVLSAQDLEHELLMLGWPRQLFVRNIGDTTFAIREKIWFAGFSYVPIMHGCMKYDPNKKELVISGFANWYVLVFSAFFFFLTLAFMYESRELLFLILLAGVLLMDVYAYLTQRRRFKEVLEIAQNILSKS